MKISTLALVCSGFRNSVSIIVNSPATSGATMDHVELRSLKSKAFTTDLSFIHECFYKEVQRQFKSSMKPVEENFNPHMVAEAKAHGEIGDCILPNVIDQYFGTRSEFCGEVELAYKKFMIVKAIETCHSEFDTHDMARDAFKRWHVRCQPACIVDAFWHSHMLFPKRFPGTLPK